ncbi:MAG: hypothetical protein NTW86_15380 [Candidatus Sumerlaeota bacterium]|nr:hypothetical protein [Candidatus Sumerlaeota bacterium]
MAFSDPDYSTDNIRNPRRAGQAAGVAFLPEDVALAVDGEDSMHDEYVVSEKHHNSATPNIPER